MLVHIGKICASIQDKLQVITGRKNTGKHWRKKSQVDLEGKQHLALEHRILVTLLEKILVNIRGKLMWWWGGY